MKAVFFDRNSILNLGLHGLLDPARRFFDHFGGELHFLAELVNACLNRQQLLLVEGFTAGRHLDDPVEFVLPTGDLIEQSLHAGFFQRALAFDPLHTGGAGSGLGLSRLQKI